MKETSLSAAASEEIPLAMLAGEADAGEAEASSAAVLDSHFQIINCTVRFDMFFGGNIRK